MIVNRGFPGFSRGREHLAVVSRGSHDSRERTVVVPQVPGTGYQVPGYINWYQVPGTWYQVAGTWYQVPGTRYLVPGTWYHVRV